MKIFNLICFAVLAFGLLQCAEDTRSIANPLNTEPLIVTEVMLPEDLSKVYYLVDRYGEYDSVLTQLLRDGVAIKQAWEPTDPSPCLCPNCFDAMIVEANSGNEILKSRGFVQETLVDLLNCGVPSFKYYQFGSK